MEQVNKEGVEGVGTGILQPALGHRWKFEVQSKDQNLVYKLAANTVRCKIMYKTNEMFLEIEENIRGDAADAVYELTKMDHFGCNIHSLSGADTINFSNEFIRTVVVDHSVEYDYAKSGIVIHKLKLAFSTMRILIPVIEKD